MGHRLSKIYTRTGDGGSTGLGDGSRIAKNSLRIEAIGAVDELNSHIGVLLAEELNENVRKCLIDVQHDLFDLGGELSIPGYTAIAETQVTRLEKILDEFNADLLPLKEFILPGGSRQAGFCHIARSVCRRAERRIISLSEVEQGSLLPQKYINRLSDLLFVLCRVINRDAKHSDVLWQQGKNK